jgi:hypothetical protein
MLNFPLIAHYKVPEAMKAVDWIVEALEEGKRDAADKDGEAGKDEEMSAPDQSHPARDTDSLENEANHVRRARNMKATETSPKAHKEIHLT